MPKIIAYSSVCAEKMYTLPFLVGVLRSLAGLDGFHIVWDGVEPPQEFVEGLREGETYSILPSTNKKKLTRIQKCARVRDASRAHFLDGDGTHLYWHDCDMIPPVGIVPALLESEFSAVSGVYNVRDYTLPLAPIMVREEGRREAVAVANTTFVESDVRYYPVLGCGQGCMLVTRDALKAVPYRDLAFYLTDEAAGEDYQWGLDYLEAHNGNCVQVDTTQTCWHVGESLNATRLVFGEMQFGAVYVGAGQNVRNSFGEWKQGQVRYDLTAEEASSLPAYEFLAKPLRHASVEYVESIEGLLP